MSELISLARRTPTRQLCERLHRHAMLCRGLSLALPSALVHAGPHLLVLGVLGAHDVDAAFPASQRVLSGQSCPEPVRCGDRSSAQCTPRLGPRTRLASHPQFSQHARDAPRPFSGRLASSSSSSSSSSSPSPRRYPQAPAPISPAPSPSARLAALARSLTCAQSSNHRKTS